MEKIFFIILCFIPLLGHSEISVGTSHHFSNSSSFVELSPQHVWMQFVMDDEGTQYLKLKIVKDEEIHITPENPAIFQGNFSMGQFRPIHDFESAETIEYIDNVETKGLVVTVLYGGNLGFFKDAHITSLKINSVDNCITVPINEKISKLIKETYETYLATSTSLNKVKIKAKNSNQGKVSLVSDYQLLFCKKKKSQRTWDIIKEITQSLTREKLEEIINDWNSQSDDKWDYQCKVRKL